MRRPDITDEALDLIKRFEGLRLKAYRDPVGVWTIGYGLTDGALPGVSVKPGMAITEQEAERYLRETVDIFADGIWSAFERQPTANQFGAMVSLAYNIGQRAFRRSTALKRFNAGDIEGAAEAMLWWNKAGGQVLRGLVRRRNAEVAMFLAEPEEPAVSVRPDTMRENPLSSTTILATITSAAGYIGTANEAVKETVGSVSETFGVAPQWIFGALVVGGLLWITRERWRKWTGGAR